MTVFTPNKKDNFNIYIGALVLALILVSGLWLYTYNLKVTVLHNISGVELELQRTRVVNAEMKNNLYSLLNPAEISIMAEARGLVKDSNPEFIQVAQR
ncbi:MAG: hypothetical protein COV57_00890 [Candidatus Liptonbacteria bacterium CG11_big_fil_rev_8_21_14_0_20_35_14]|uniref:Cell division protein FtsL n=1 Tax=Candidatus Liptonbacteria bacterium CG11_big_fil_rev_8_21_14_0_20_35_14 TaxID=1974634 RepID=A0A2H0N877_9BACT|nr:MAG: hypothetical protein COV57_00890 [Candidatus Liptonbacteria bacterium CG11_big_fil_rev_8_21_14_0_20_35_14]